jgi:RES domain-containing protein
MKAYRISAVKYAGSLQPSGVGARWNKKGEKVIYASGSRSLACLENLVHRFAPELNGLYKTLIIELPDDLKIEELTDDQLPKGWNRPGNYQVCQETGSSWFAAGRTAILKVPSALIPQEYNFVLNTTHRDFTRILLAGKEDFLFDPRIILRNNFSPE